MAEDRHRGKYIPFRCSTETNAMITHIADAEGKTKSEVLRMLVEKGLAAGGYVPGIRGMDEIVREAVAEAIGPTAERLASISAKAAHISAASFFLALYTDRLLAPDYARSEIDGIAAQARRLGVEYLKLSKDKSVDEWLAQACSRMTGK